MASALSTALTIYPCQIRVHQRGQSYKLQLFTARKKDWWPATADSLPQAVYLTTVKHTNMVDRITRCRDMAIRVCWGIWNPIFWGKGGRRGSAMAPLERTMVVYYRLSIVTVALSVTIRPQFAIESTGGG